MGFVKSVGGRYGISYAVRLQFSRFDHHLGSFVVAQTLGQQLSQAMVGRWIVGAKKPLFSLLNA